MSSPASHFYYFSDQNNHDNAEHDLRASPHDGAPPITAGTSPDLLSLFLRPQGSADSNLFRRRSFQGRTSLERSELSTSLLQGATHRVDDSVVDEEHEVDGAVDIGSSPYPEAARLPTLPDVENNGQTSSQPSSPENEAPAAASLLEEIFDVKSSIFGAVNTIVTLPSMVAFANIIFKSPKFAPWMPIIVRLLFLSAGIHQLAFVFRSKVPGAIGQVQDVGLIFLSAMTTSIVNYGEDNDLPFVETLSTALLTITVSTAIVGGLIIVIAKLRIASFVQYVPVPVVGGYLAYVGYFCCVAGVSLAADQDLDTIQDWMEIFNVEALLRVLPMLGTWLVLHLTVHYVSNPLGLPAAMCAIPLVFYIALYASGHTLKDAQDAKWTPAPVEGGAPPFWEAWGMFHFEDFPGNIHWAAVSRQVPNLMALFFVVSFGSCMDIAAIQAECPFQLNFDRELELIGLSNGLCGILGAGFTGSYIFSQTLFNFRWGAWGRMIGVVVSISEIILFLAPISIIEYIPSFFFGGLMFWFGVDIAYDWLANAFGKVRRVEYALIWISFAAVMLLGLEGGIGLGCVLAALQFTWEYARLSSSSITILPSLSSNMRSYDQRSILQMMQGHMVTVSLKGYIFFGSALRISSEVQQIAEGMAATRAALTEASMEVTADKLQNAANELQKTAPSFMLLDFQRVSGFDASSAQAFCGLRRKLKALRIQLIICGIPRQAAYIKRLLLTNGVIAREPDGSVANGSLFDTLDLSLLHCEEQILKVAMDAGWCPERTDKMSFAKVLEAHLNFPTAILPGEMNYDTVASRIMPFLETRELAAMGDTLFGPGEPCSRLYIIQTGEMRLEIDFSTWAGVNPHEHNSSLMSRRFKFECPGSSRSSPVQFVVYGPGGILGDTDFFLHQPYSFKACCSKAPCRVWSLSHDSLNHMLERSPGLLVVIQAMVLRSQCMTAKHSIASLEMLAAST